MAITVGGGADAIKRASTTYTSLFLDRAAVTTEALAQVEMQTAGTLSRLDVHLSAAAGSGSTGYTVVVRVNGADTALTCSMVGAQSTCDENAASVSFAAGDLVSVAAVPTVTQPTDNLDMRFTLKLTPAS
ncbi:MAG: hypothetical protein ACKOTZ_07270 [Chloroflexota bacterium]